MSISVCPAILLFVVIALSACFAPVHTVENRKASTRKTKHFFFLCLRLRNLRHPSSYVLSLHLSLRLLLRLLHRCGQALNIPFIPTSRISLNLNKVSHSSSAKFQRFPKCPTATQKARLHKIPVVLTFNIYQILTGYMLAVKISIKKNMRCSICELSPVMATDIAYFTKLLDE